MKSTDRRYALGLCVCIICFQVVVQAFVVPDRSIVIISSHDGRGAANHQRNSALFSSPIPTGDRPPPRRTLKKRKNKRRQRLDRLSKKSDGASTRSGGGRENDDDVEIRPVRRRDAVEAGLDYWIDEGDLVREKERKIALKNRKSMEGAISKEKLRKEVVAPYTQNWIGIFSVFIVILSAIGTKFPELLQIPVIPIPDL